MPEWASAAVLTGAGIIFTVPISNALVGMSARLITAGLAIIKMHLGQRVLVMLI